MQCVSEFYDLFSKTPIYCERADSHPGGHQSWSGGWVWTAGGGHTFSRDSAFCPTCGTQDVKSDGLRERIEGDQCSTCDFWEERAEAYSAGGAFVAHGRAYVLNPQNPHGFGGRKVTVKFFHGEAVGPTPGLWDNGEVPHEWRELMPDNAEIVWG